MNIAIEAAIKGIKNGQTPFGAAIVKDEKILVSSHNQVWSTTDITAHAEIVAVREACKILNSTDLSGCEIYSTCEPCPMCFGAIHWGRFNRIIYGATIDDAKDAGFNELNIHNSDMKKYGGSQVDILSGVEKDKCIELFSLWKSINGDKIY